MDKIVESLLSLHQYWIYSNRMRILFREELKNIADRGAHNINDNMEGFLQNHLFYLGDFNVFRAYWYGSLFVVIEGYGELGIKMTNVEALMNEDYIKRLRLFRNGNFHLQKDFYPEKTLKVDHEDEFIAWINKIHKELGKSILREITKKFPKGISENILNTIKKTTGEDLAKYLNQD